MREIKFRGKTYESRLDDEPIEWVYDDDVLRDGNKIIVIDIQPDEMEVIGNIFDNSDLIKDL